MLETIYINVLIAINTYTRIFEYKWNHILCVYNLDFSKLKFPESKDEYPFNSISAPPLKLEFCRYSQANEYSYVHTHDYLVTRGMYVCES